MPRFTIDDLWRILRECAGEADPVSGHPDTRDVGFTAMGYDSLALLEMASRIQQEFAVPISDDDLARMQTPADVIGYINTKTAPQ